ncbi:hypothetical protein [Saccharothrix sp. Mg75]|uniref:hypothetical protein n=1 Tax=Saccharothrix sp. Mg75 TaxID=3445357 RepID=UPI003EEF8CBB
MSRHRTRGLLRAAALLAAGASPLLAPVANAAEAPLDVVDDAVGRAPAAGLDVAKPATDLLGGRSVALPAPAAAALPEVKAPHVAAPAGVQPASTPSVPANADALVTDALTGSALTGGALGVGGLAPTGRALPTAPAVPGAEQLVQSGEAPHVPALGGLPVQAPQLP